MTDLHVPTASPLVALSPNSPSFNAYSSSNLAQIAARVVKEFALEDEALNGSDHFYYFMGENDPDFLQKHGRNDDGCPRNDVVEEEEEEFEFAFVGRDQVNSSPITADEIFFNGQIKPIYPLFDRSLLLDDHQEVKSPPSTVVKSRRPRLRKLFDEERESTTSSCSSSGAGELDGVQKGTYCVWMPKKMAEETASCKKSNSTGSSKRWKLRDLLYRSNSERKDSFVTLTPSKAKKEGRREEGKGKENYKAEGKEGNDSVVEEHLNKVEGYKRQSFLPYRQDLIGFFSHVNGFDKNKVTV